MAEETKAPTLVKEDSMLSDDTSSLTTSDSEGSEAAAPAAGAPPAATTPAARFVVPDAPPAGFTERDIFFCFCQLLIDELPKELRVLFKALWRRKYPAFPWLDDDAATNGDRFLYGVGDGVEEFDVDLGDVLVRGKSDKAKSAAGQEWFVPKAFGGSRLKINGQAVWIQKAQKDNFVMKDKWPGNDGRNEVRCRAFGRRQDIYEVNKGPKSAINNKPSMIKVRSGEIQDWDFTLLLFALVNSAHGLLDGLPDLLGALENQRGVRKVRNAFFGHIEKTTMPWSEFRKSMKKFVDVMDVAEAAGIAGTEGGALRLLEVVRRLLAAPPPRNVDREREYVAQLSDWYRAAMKLEQIGDSVQFLEHQARRQDADDARHPLQEHTLSKIKEKRDRFFGRGWLFGLVRDWLDDQRKQRTMLLEGEGGVGKSAFVAELVGNPAGLVKQGFNFRVGASHFCDAQRPLSLDPELFARGLLVSLTLLPGVETFLVEQNECENLGHLMRRLQGADVILEKIMDALQAVSKHAGGAGGTWLIVVDSMDEALCRKGQSATDNIMGVF
eukprot:g3065.t1